MAIANHQENNKQTGTGAGQTDGSLEVWMITGLSGAGKTNAIRILEDWDYYCIDNLPPALLVKTVETIRLAGSTRHLALGVDVRSGMLFDMLIPALDDLVANEGKPKILFLDADTPTLVNRYKESRRPHPMDDPMDYPMDSASMLAETIESERIRLEPIRERADVIIDTSDISVKALKETLEKRVYSDSGEHIKRFRVHVISFGYKYGIPMDADLLMDVRFLPNPHYIPDLRPLTGMDPAVRDYVMNHDVSQMFFKKFSELLFYLIPNYIEEGKTNLVVAIGCTGGRHRSVTLAEMLFTSLSELNEGYYVDIRHRDAYR